VKEAVFSLFTSLVNSFVRNVLRSTPRPVHTLQLLVVNSGTDSLTASRNRFVVSTYSLCEADPATMTRESIGIKCRARVSYGVT
jgi:hypothetical protein